MRMITALGVVGLMACTEPVETKVNTAPYFTDISASPAEGITTSTELICIANALDDDDDTLTLTYQWVTSDGTVLANTDTVLLTPDTVQPNEELTCNAMVSDGTDTASTSVSVTLENTAPEIASVSISPETVLIDSLLQCSFEASDADGEELTVSYSWTQNGTEVGTGASLQLDADNFADDDEITCTVTVEDGFGGSATESAMVVVGNTAPSIGSVTLNPETAISTDDITCVVADVVDLEGDEVSISYEWTIDGEVQTETSDMLAGPFTVNSEIICTATPNDTKVDGASVTASLVIENTAPVVDAVVITPNTNVEANTLLTCAGTVSDIDNETLTTSYAWTFNGTVMGTDATWQLDAATVSPDDVLTCTVTVEDTHGASDMASAAITVVNTAPVVDTAAMVSGDTTVGSILMCEASFSDLNDGTLTPSYEWTVNGSSVGTGMSYTIDANSVITGNYVVCTATAVDSDGASVSSSDAITVTNSAPFLSGVSISPNPILSTSDVMCSVANYGDADGDSVNITYNWTVDGTMQSEHGDTLMGPFSVGANIACEAVPNDGIIDGTSEAVIAMVSNSLPMVDSVELDSDPVLTDGVVTATDTLSDIDVEQTVTASYEWFVNGTSVQSGSMNTLDGSFFSKGDEVYVTVTPNDGMEDGAAVTSASITIANTMPTVDSVTVTLAGPSYNDSVLTCDAVVTDPDETPTLTYSWSIGSAEVGTAATLDLSQVGAMPMDVVECTVLATDSDNADDIGMDSRTLDNREPTISGLAISPNTDVTTSTALTCGFTSADLDGESLTETVMWTVGANIYTGTTLTLDPSMVNPGETVTCEVLVEDNYSGSALDTVSVTVINTAPVFDVAASISPSTVYANSTVSCSGTVSDADGETAGMTYLWENVTTGMTLGTTDTITLTTSDAAKDDNIQCTITATDGTDSVDSVANVTVMNSVPTIDSLSLSPALIYTNTDVQAVATGSDLEGSALTWNYTWFVDGTQVQDGSSDTLSSTFFVKDQIVSVDVTVNDGDDTSATQSDSETVSNSVPTAPVVSISPTDPVEGVDDLICSVDTASTDADGDAITYTFEWTVDGTAYTGATDSAMDSIVDAVDTTANEEWICTVTPDDGTDFGSLASDSSTVTSPTSSGAYYELVGTPSPNTVFNTIERTYYYPNNLMNQIWHGPSNLIVAGHSSNTNYWVFDAESAYTTTPNIAGNYDRIVHVPKTGLLFASMGSAQYPNNVSTTYVADMDTSTGDIGTFNVVSFADGYSGDCNLYSNSEDEFMCFNGTEIRVYDTTMGSNVVTLNRVITVDVTYDVCSSYCFGGTFAWDGMYFYFSDVGSGSSNKTYDVLDANGTFVNSYTATGNGAINSTYFDWSVGRYTTHDGFGGRSGGTIYYPSNGSQGDDSQTYSGISSVHSAVSAVNVTTTGACGSILHEDPYQLGVPTGWVLCYIDETDTAYHNTPCNQLLQDLDNGWGSSDLLSAGGNFGCWHGSSQTPEGASYATNNVVSMSCRDNIQQSTVLSAWNTNTTTLGVCIKYP